MKILFFGDIHNETHALKKIEGDFDFLLITGDLTQIGGRKEALLILEQIKEFFPKYYAVAGNMDKPEIGLFLEELDLNYHGKGILITPDIGIFGCGGSSPTPFNTPNEISEEEIYRVLKKGYDMIAGASLKIMVCHTPPFDTPCDKLPNGVHVGSKLVRSFIEEVEPDFCLTGHIHEGIGMTNIGSTLVVNPGPFQMGNYGILDTDRKTVELFKT